MSVGQQGKTTNTADDAFGAKSLDERQAIWGEIPGRIVSMDPVKQTATIQPLYKPKFNGVPVDMPQLLEVPVRFTRAGNAAMTFPVKSGDFVTLRPQMRSSENYHTDGDGSASDARSFSPSDYEAFLDGGESLTNPIPNFDPENVHLRADADGTFGIKLTPSGQVEIKTSQGEMVDLLARIAELTGDGFELLSTEPELIHTSEYAAIGVELHDIATKLRGVQV